MTASATDLIRKASAPGVRPVAANLDQDMAATDTTATLTVTTGWGTETAIDVIIYQTDAAGAIIDGTQTDWTAVCSGDTLSGMILRAGTMPDNGYPASTQTIVICSPTAAWGDDIATALLDIMNQDGSLKTAPVQAALNLGSSALNGWNALGSTPSTVTYNGNGFYDLRFTGVDLRTTLPCGTRIRTTRTVTPPTGNCVFNGTTQYWSNTTPSGMTFTDDFTVSAWIKVTNYAYPTTSMAVISRTNGTNGWALYVMPTGVIQLVGYNGGLANYSFVQSYQAIPLNEWVHVTAQLDMSTFTATATTSYVMLDGDPNTQYFVGRNGTNPTALIQAGSLQIGAANGATNPFNGVIAQAAVWNTKIAQATMQNYISQSLLGTETGLVSAYAFSANANDLNTTTANNLTANGSIVVSTATGSDNPFSYPASTNVAATTLNYGVVTFVNTSGSDTIVSVKTAYFDTIPTIGGVSAVVYASAGCPSGFPPSLMGNIRLGRAIAAGGQTTSGVTDLQGFTVSLPVIRGIKEFQFDITVNASCASAGTQWVLQLYDGTNLVHSWNMYSYNATNSFSYPVNLTLPVVLGVTHAYKLTVNPSGTGITTTANATGFTNEMVIRAA